MISMILGEVESSMYKVIKILLFIRSECRRRDFFGGNERTEIELLSAGWSLVR